MRETYPSDITREQFALINQDLENANKTTRPRKIDLYEVFCAYCIYSKTLVRGVLYRTIFQTIVMYTIITKYGLRRV
jgi:hypothetical protein